MQTVKMNLKFTDSLMLCKNTAATVNAEIEQCINEPMCIYSMYRMHIALGSIQVLTIERSKRCVIFYRHPLTPICKLFY